MDVRKDRNINPERYHPTNTTDICWAKLTGTQPLINVTNVYRPLQEKVDDSVISILKRWHVPRNCIIAGNLKKQHPIWDSRAEETGHAKKLDIKMQNSDLQFISPITIPTYGVGSTLDLTFSNIFGSTSAIEQHLHTISDHEKLINTINVRCQSTMPIYYILARFKETPEASLRLVEGVWETLSSSHLFP